MTRARGRWAWAVAAVAALPLAELVVALVVGRAIGGWPTMALLLATSVVGVVVLRREGRATWEAFSAAARSGRPPGTGVADGALAMAGGLLLAVPGFVTGVAGVVCLLPPARPLARRLLQAWAARWLVRHVPPGAGTARRADGRLVEGEVVDGEAAEGGVVGGEVGEGEHGRGRGDRPDDEDRPRPGG